MHIISTCDKINAVRRNNMHKISRKYNAEKMQEGRRMNILFYLVPKSEVMYLYDDYKMRQAIEKME